MSGTRSSDLTHEAGLAEVLSNCLVVITACALAFFFGLLAAPFLVLEESCKFQNPNASGSTFRTARVYVINVVSQVTDFIGKPLRQPPASLERHAARYYES